MFNKRFIVTLLALLSTIATTAALGVFTTPELDITSAGRDRRQVPAPQPAARFRQATRADVVARQARGPAKRQNSATSICNRPFTGTTPYAIFTDAFFFPDFETRSPYAASLEQCYADCEADPGKWSIPGDREGTSDKIELTRTVCVAVTYISTQSNSCFPLSSLADMGTFGGGQMLNGVGQGEAKGMTCAQVKAMYTCKSFPTDDVLVTVH
jgi:hypothetical protein